VNGSSQPISITSAVKDLRKLVEHDAGTSIEAIIVNAAGVLDDISAHV